MSGGQARAVLVTGASRGIGAAIARAFALVGDRVAVHHGRSADVAERVVASLAAEGHVVVGADLADAAAVQRMVDSAADRLGGLDVVVNNAGVFQPHPITETSYEEWQRAWHETLSVNLVGAANVSWCAAQHMIRGGGGSIVNVSSRVSRRTRAACLRREQGWAHRPRPVPGSCARTVRDLCHVSRARTRRDRHGRREPRWRARRATARGKPARPHRHSRRGGRSSRVSGLG